MKKLHIECCNKSYLFLCVSFSLTSFVIFLHWDIYWNLWLATYIRIVDISFSRFTKDSNLWDLVHRLFILAYSHILSNICLLPLHFAVLILSSFFILLFVRLAQLQLYKNSSARISDRTRKARLYFNRNWN